MTAPVCLLASAVKGSMRSYCDIRPADHTLKPADVTCPKCTAVLDRLRGYTAADLIP